MDPDPDPGVPKTRGSGSATLPITYFKYIFHVKIQIFLTLKSDTDHNPHGSAFVGLPGSMSALKSVRILNTAVRSTVRN
jgi:hypothetical protein